MINTNYFRVLALIAGAVLATLLLVGMVQRSAIAAPASSSWDYVAHGDSLATGFGAFSGYVPRYKSYTETDTRASMRLNNLGQNGWTSSQLLYALKNDPKFRRATREAEVVTFDIGGNDLRAAGSSYKSKSCGGANNQACLESAVRDFKANWDAITAEILALRSTNNTIIRTMDLYNPYVTDDKVSDTWQDDGGLNDFQVFKQYLDQVNSHIATTSTSTKIPYAKVYLAFNGPNGDEDPKAKGYISFDGLHPNDTGHRIIADKLRELGYSPLR